MSENKTPDGKPDLSQFKQKYKKAHLAAEYVLETGGYTDKEHKLGGDAIFKKIQQEFLEVDFGTIHSVKKP